MKRCYMCLEKIVKKDKFCPCSCSKKNMFLHRKCLDKFIKSQSPWLRGKCHVCHDIYKFEYIGGGGGENTISLSFFKRWGCKAVYTILNPLSQLSSDECYVVCFVTMVLYIMFTLSIMAFDNGSLFASSPEGTMHILFMVAYTIISFVMMEIYWKIVTTVIRNEYAYNHIHRNNDMIILFGVFTPVNVAIWCRIIKYFSTMPWWLYALCAAEMCIKYIDMIQYILKFNFF